MCDCDKWCRGQPTLLKSTATWYRHQAKGYIYVGLCVCCENSSELHGILQETKFEEGEDSEEDMDDSQEDTTVSVNYYIFINAHTVF